MGWKNQLNVKGDIFMVDKVKLHKEIAAKLSEIYEKKNHDYGDSFGETFRKLGPISAITRMSDKFNRLCALITLPDEERKVKDESIEDTIMDLANYTIMTAIEMKLAKGITSITSNPDDYLTTNPAVVPANLNGTSVQNYPSSISTVVLEPNPNDTKTPIKVVDTAKSTDSGANVFTAVSDMISKRLEKLIEREAVLVYFNEEKEIDSLMDVLNGLNYYSHLSFTNIDKNEDCMYIMDLYDWAIKKKHERTERLKFIPSKGYLFFVKNPSGSTELPLYDIYYVGNIHTLEESYAVASCTELFNPASICYDNEHNYKFAQHF